MNPEVTVVVNPSTICYGETSTLTASGGHTYMWWDLNTQQYISSNQSITVSPPDTNRYRAVAITNVGHVQCTDTGEVTLNVIPLPEINLPVLPGLCVNHGVFNLPLATPPGGTWSGPGVNSNRIFTSNAGAGTHWLTYTYTDQTKTPNCTNRDSVQIRIFELPEVGPFDLKEICTGDELFIFTGKPAGGSWSGPMIESNSGVYWVDPSKLTVGNRVYTYTYEDQNGCVNTATKTLRVFRTQEITTGEYGPYCNDDLVVTLGGTPGGNNGVWTGPGVTNRTFNPASVNFGTHELTFTYTTNDGCISEAKTQVVVNRVPVVNVELDGNVNRVCINEDPINIDITTNIQGGTGVWMGGFNNGISNGRFDPSIAGEGNHILRYEYTMPTGCKSSDQFEVYVRAMPKVEIVSDNPVLCIGLPYEVEAEFSNANSISWTSTGGGQFQNINPRTVIYTPSAADNQTGAFMLTVETVSADVCPEDNVTMEVIMRPLPVAEITLPDNACEPFQGTFSSSNSQGNIVVWDWDFGSGITSSVPNPQASYENLGTYNISLRVETEFGCEDETSANITVYPRPVPEFIAIPEFTTIASPIIEFENRTNTKTSNEVNYLWNFGDFALPDGGTSTTVHPKHMYQNVGKYDISLTAINEYDCEATLVKPAYIIIEPDITVFIPSAFTPNGQGPMANRTFYAVTGGLSAFEMIVYNRWGQVVFQTNDPDMHWDGTDLSGNDVGEDVYVYIVNATSLDGNKYKYSGTVTLIR